MDPRNPIRCLVPGLSLNLIGTGVGGTNQIVPDSSGAFGQDGSNTYWDTIGTPTYDSAVFQYDTFSDVTGLVRGEQTLFPVYWNATPWLNPKAAWFSTTASAQVKAYELDMIWFSTTSKPDALDISTPGWEERISGAQYSLQDNKTFTELVGYGWSSFTTEGQVTTSATLKTGSGSFGYLTPTASTRIYHRCFLRVTNWSPSNSATSDKIDIFPSVITLGQEIDRESDLEYIMRLQRMAIRDPV